MRSDWHKILLPSLCGAFINMTIGGLLYQPGGVSVGWGVLYPAIVLLGVFAFGGLIAGFIAPFYHWISGAITTLPIFTFAFVTLYLWNDSGIAVDTIFLVVASIGVATGGVGGYIGGYLRKLLQNRKKKMDN